MRLETWANLRGLAKYLYNTRASCMIITTYSPLSHTKIPVRQFCRAVPQHCCALGGFATKCTRNTFTYSCKCAHITGTAVHEHVAGTWILSLFPGCSPINGRQWPPRRWRCSSFGRFEIEEGSTRQPAAVSFLKSLKQLH